MNQSNQAKENLDVYLQANRLYIQQQLYNAFNIQCIQMNYLSQLDLAKMQTTIKRIFDFGNNQAYEYFFSHLSQNIKNYIKEQYAAKAIASYYVLDIQKLIDILQYCIKHGFQTVQNQTITPPISKPQAAQQKTVKIQQFQPMEELTKIAQPKDQFKHVKPKISTHLPKQKIPEKKQFKIEKYEMPDTKVAARISTFLEKDKIPLKKEFKIEKYQMPEIKASAKVSTFLQKDRIPEKRQFRIQKYAMPQIKAMPRYLISIPKNVIQKQQQEKPQMVVPLDSSYLAVHRKVMSQRLEKLFQFYCMEQQNLGQGPTFDRIQNQSQMMNLGKFMQFCNYTKLFHGKQLQKDTLVAEYKKISQGKLQIDFRLFEKLIIKLDEIYLNALGHDSSKNPRPTYEARLMLNEPNRLGQLKKHRHLIFGNSNLDDRQNRHRSDTARIQKKLTAHTGRFSQELHSKLKDRNAKSIQAKSTSPSAESGRIELRQLHKMRLPKLNWIIEEQVEVLPKVTKL